MDILVDSNIHVIAPPAERSRYPLSPMQGSEGQPAEEDANSPDDCASAMAAAGVHQAYLMASRFHGFDNSYCADAVARHPDRFVGVANVNILSPDAPERVAYWIEQRGMHGVRFWGNGPGLASWIEQDNVLPAWKEIMRLKVPVNAHTTKPPALPATLRLLRRFPDMKLSLNYMAHVPVDKGPGSEPARQLLELAQFPHTYVNFPTDFMLEVEAMPAARELLLALVESFGAARMLWSSFYPLHRSHALGEWVAILKRGLAFLSAEQRALVLGGAARELYPALKKASPAIR